MAKRKKKRKLKRDLILLIDLEATCWDRKPPAGMYNEIIEIGISALDYRTKEIKLKDTIIVKPQFSEISEYCTNLTSITQEMVDEKGVTLAEACKILEDTYKSKDRIWASWGEYDNNQIKRECKHKKIENPFGRTHINMKPLFSFAYGLHTDYGVGEALEHLGMEFEGNAHRGVDDAYNIARILKKVFIPLMVNPKYGRKEEKMEHEVLSAKIDSTYNKVDLDNNVARIINKSTPENPDKSHR